VGKPRRPSLLILLSVLASSQISFLVPGLVSPASALIPEPPHLVRGTVTVNGAPRNWGTVAINVHGSPDACATFQLGTLPESANGYLLEVPMDALDPRSPGRARPGNPAQIFLDGQPVAAVTIGERGGFQTVDLTVTAPHEITMIRGPTAIPSTVASGGQVYLFAEAADTMDHTLGYFWSADCPGSDDGSFADPLVRTALWTAPTMRGADPRECALTVTAAEVGQGGGQEGLLLQRSLVVRVLPAPPSPDPVALFAFGPDATHCGEAITFDGSASYHGNPTQQIDLYEWEFDYDGVAFHPDAAGVSAAYSYPGRAGTVTAALRVSDDSVPPRTALITHEVHPGTINRPPTAVAGSYLAHAGKPLALDGRGSSDPDSPCGDAVTIYSWDLNADTMFDDAAGAQPVLPWSQVESQICQGRCVHGTSYPIALEVADTHGAVGTAGGAVTPSMVLFLDTFDDGTAKGDPEWLVKSGSWTVSGAGELKHFTSTSPTKPAVAVPMAIPARGFTAGSLESSIALTTRYPAFPNGAIVFAYRDAAHYRYLRLDRLNRLGTGRLVLGQAGVIGADLGGAKISRTFAGLTMRTWYRLWVDVYADGRVKVYFKNRTRPVLTYKFKAAAPGTVGCRAVGAQTNFDDFTVWDEGVLP
jgi:hypothetical protein